MTRYEEIKARTVVFGETNNDLTEPLPAVTTSPFQPWEGRLFGGLVLSAFLLYGIGSSISDETAGLVLVAANSIAVTVVGLIGFRLLQNQNRQVGVLYFATRIAEAILLGGGIALHEFADVSGADNTGYLLGMTVLGLGSLPFWRARGQGARLPNRFALWGVVGYIALAAGAIIELVTGQDVLIAFAVPGGLFELAVGVYLLLKGFAPTSSKS